MALSNNERHDRQDKRQDEQDERQDRTEYAHDERRDAQDARQDAQDRRQDAQYRRQERQDVRQEKAKEGWAEYQRLVLTELERHAAADKEFDVRLRDLHTTAVQNSTLLQNIQEQLTLANLAEMKVVLAGLVESDEKQNNRLTSLEFKWYAAVAGLITALAILVGVLTGLIGG